MKVSQYIYTACGKDRKGAFSVFSKSRDITEEENSDIFNVMMYPEPEDLPREATDEQIAKCPKKYGYFKLSSGRVCLAQACYIGKVYSDFDKRSGNFIIHAFVFDRNTNFVPFSFYEHSIFKRLLTKQEWHDDPILEDYPQTEIPDNGGVLSIDEFTSFFNDDKKQKLKILIEAIINSTNENHIYFAEDHTNLKYWFKALSLLLPKDIQNKVSFCTHFTNALYQNASSSIKIRINRPESSQFNYSDEAQRGYCAIDVSRNIFTNKITPSKYVGNVLKLTSLGIFEVIKYVDGINSVMEKYLVNVNQASQLINLYTQKFDYFDSIDELFETVLLAEGSGYHAQDIATSLWKNIKGFSFNVNQKIKILAFIYKNVLTIDIKVDIIRMLINNAESFGFNTGGAKEFLAELKSKVDFIFSNYLDYLKSEGLDDYVSKNHASFVKLYVSYVVLLNSSQVKSSLQSQNFYANSETTTVLNIVESTFNKQSITDLDLLLNTANSIVSNLGNDMLSAIVKDIVKMTTRINNVQFAFDILMKIKIKDDLANDYLTHLINTITEFEPFIKEYIKAQNNDKPFFTKFENDNKDKPVMVNFETKKEVYKFSNMSLNTKSLKDYFEKYYLIGKDTGMFLKRLDDYVNGFQPAKRLDEGCNIINDLKLLTIEDLKLLSPIYVVIFDAMFTAPYKDIYNLCRKKDWKEWFEKLNEIYDIISKTNGKLKPETVELFTITICGRIVEKYNSNLNNRTISFFSNPQTDVIKLADYFKTIKSSKVINIFIDTYFQSVANILIIGTSNVRQYDYDGTIKKAFEEVFENGDSEKISTKMTATIKSSHKDSRDFMLYYLRKHIQRTSKGIDESLCKSVIGYFEDLSTKERTKLFAEIQSSAETKERDHFQKFFEEFNKQNKRGFFDIFKRKK